MSADPDPWIRGTAPVRAVCFVKPALLIRCVGVRLGSRKANAEAITLPVRLCSTAGFAGLLVLFLDHFYLGIEEDLFGVVAVSCLVGGVELVAYARVFYRSHCC